MEVKMQESLMAHKASEADIVEVTTAGVSVSLVPASTETMTCPAHMGSTARPRLALRRRPRLRLRRRNAR